jgi:predicted alpha/beta hydrolase family esterase
MAPARQVLFIQGGGADAHDEWDDKLVESLRRELGEGYEVRYPRMPDEGDPGYTRWSTAIRREMADLDDGAVAVGHSIGAAILVSALADQPPESGLAAVVLIAAPFVGLGGWPGGEFELTSDLGARLPSGAQVHVFHGLRDESAPASHADLYARAVPQAQVHRLPGRNHQLNNDLSEVAEAIRTSTPRPLSKPGADTTSYPWSRVSTRRHAQTAVPNAWHPERPGWPHGDDLPTPRSEPHGITLGPDHALWTALELVPSPASRPPVRPPARPYLARRGARTGTAAHVLPDGI